ncbi:ATP-binding protein [Pseudomonas huanghezhanensis]|uniref:ATP-binding protein n=1 Tax=Pseudomonas huanghezhanensis TaxID=3002903 RepID=UPI0022856D84|nr:ATP-binding protein [Pseudomonas sp. BSw22131]
MTHDYIRHLQNDFHRTREKDIFAENLLPVENTATSFSVIGCSGVGKSKAIEKILHQYPRRIAHTEPFSLVQLPWLKLDCPHQGSPRQLCKNFFASVDKLLCTEYEKLYGNVRAGLDEMLVHMAQVANLHALGLLVIDEIQHLRKSKSSQNLAGSDQLLNFLVTLVNMLPLMQT